MHTENMKRKVAKVAPLRLSPNEEALILKQERERRRKLRLQQVREQEKFIAQQIRQDVKDRRDQQLQRLAEDLKAKWETEQGEKLRALEEVYLSTLNAIGEAHRQAKENEPDLKAIERTAALNKEKAEKRHREALKELQHHREKLLRDQTWHIKARRKALYTEKERAARIASLPPPPPDPLENLEVVRRPLPVKLCNVDGFSLSHYHLPEAYVDREKDTEQPDARVAAVEEGKRLESLQKEEERERREQMEKATLRGSCALKMVHLTQDQGRLIKELEHMQQEDLVRRRQIVSKMPQQLFEPPYRRAEILEEWQRELESAFEDMYTKDSKMKGDMVLHLKPQPLPDPSVASIDEDLDISAEPEAVSEIEPQPEGRSNEPPEAGEPQSRLVLKRLLSRIRTQKDQWSSKSDAASATETLESGSLLLENVAQDGLQEERKSASQEPKELTDNTVLAGKSVLLHPQEHAARIRLETERKHKMEEIDRQKMEQLELLKKLEEERWTLEEEYGRIQRQMQESSGREMEQEPDAAPQGDRPAPAALEAEPVEVSVCISEANLSAENLHIQIIREYQQRLIEQNRLHKQSVEEARKRLQEYQLLLKRRYPHLSTSSHTAERNLEGTGGGQSPKPEGEKYANAYNATVSDQCTSTVMMNHDYEQKHEAHTPQISRALGTKRTSPRSTLQDPEFTGDFLQNDSEVSNRPDQKIKSFEATIVSKNGSVAEGPPEEQLPYTDSLYQSPHEDKSQLPHIGDRLSFTSSPGQYETSSSTSYNPLPSELSLGRPHVDFFDPVIPLPLPCLGETDKDHTSLGDFSNVREFREQLLSSTADIQAQQVQLKAMQDNLDKQRDSLLSKQKSQEERLLQKQRQLEEQMKLHQQAIENVIGSRKPEERLESDFCWVPRKEQYNLMSTLLEEFEDSSQDDLQQESSNEFSSGVLIKPSGREHRWRPTKPPVTKTKLGPLLERHELSAIMEVETPISGRRSSTGLAESSANFPSQSDISRTNEAVFGHPETSRSRADTSSLSRLSNRSTDQTCTESRNRSHTKLSWKELLSVQDSHDPTGTGQPNKILSNVHHGELDRSGLSTSSMDQSHPKLSWREMLSLDHSHHSGHTDLFPTPKASVSPAADTAVPLINPSIPERASQYGESMHGRSSDGVGENLSTTISTGSFLTSEKTDSSPASSDALSELHRCNYSIIGEAQDGSSSPSAAKTVTEHEMRWSAFLSPLVEDRSHIQQIIEKYTQALSVSLERNSSFHSPEAALDISAAGTFYSLDPKPDFSVSTSSSTPSNQTSRSLYSRDVSQAPQNSGCLEQQIPPSFLHSGADAMPFHGSAVVQTVDLARNSFLGGPAAPEPALDISAADNRFPTSFYSLDPKPDFSVSTLSCAFFNQSSSSPYARDVSRASQHTNSREQQLHRSSPSSPHSDAADLRSSLGVAMSQNFDRSSSTNMAEPANSSGSFLPLHPDSTLNDTNVSNQHETSYRILSQRLEHVSTGGLRDGSPFSQAYSYEQNSNPIYMGPNYTPSLATQAVAEESGSFHELMATKTTVNDSELSEHLIPYHEEKNNSQAVHFEELPVVHKDDQCQEDLGTIGHFSPDHKEPETSVSPRLESCSSTATEMDASNKTLVSGSPTLGSSSVSSLNLMSSLLTGSSAGSLPSCVYTWGSGSARGIMEEPDLTLLSLNDSSIAGSEPGITRSTVSDSQEDGSSVQRGFKPLPVEADASGVGQPDQSSFGASLSQHFAEIDMEFTSTPGNLQEAFQKKKKQFIEKSSKRIQDIKARERLPTMDRISEPEDQHVAQANLDPGSDSMLSDGGQLKKVVEVRVSTPEDRKLSEIEMHQRTIRLYNQLDEVKTRKEEMMRQEAYARNREKAKEFKKRTLEKLRGNKMK